MSLHLAEILLSPVFVLGGLATLRNPQPRAEQLARFRLPFPTLLVRLNGAVMVAAGLCLALNILPGIASVVLALVLVPTTVFGHAFWFAEEGGAREEQLSHFVKNVAVLGGLVAIIIAAG